jgi:phosphoserine phosphatase RsbU/P
MSSSRRHSFNCKLCLLACTQMAKDDIFVAYTDGITEAANPSGQFWGLERLESLLRSCSRMTPREIVERILAEVSEFANGEPQSDDMTLVVMKVQEAPTFEVN